MRALSPADPNPRASNVPTPKEGEKILSQSKQNVQSAAMDAHTSQTQTDESGNVDVVSYPGSSEHALLKEIAGKQIESAQTYAKGELDASGHAHVPAGVHEGGQFTSKIAKKDSGGKSMFDPKYHYFRIQPKGKGVKSHRSEDSAGETNTLHVFENPYYALHAEGNPKEYGNVVVAIWHEGGHADNGDVEGVGIKPTKKTKIVKRWSLNDFAKEMFPTATGDDDDVTMAYAGNEHWYHA